MRTRLLLPLLILALAWGQELIDQLLFAGQWNLPMGPDQPWWGVITAPFSHAGFGHLISNSLAFLPLSWLVLSRGMRDYLSVWLSVLLINIPVALFWPARSHGLSGVVYGLLGYLLLIGWLERRILSIILALVATYRGYTCEPNAAGVSRATTSTVVTTSVCILVADYILTSLWGV